MSTTRSGRAPRLRRLAAAATGGALITAGLLGVGPAPAAQAEPVNPEAGAAATWLADQLTEDGVFDSGFDALGSTIDFGLSLRQTDPESPTLATLREGVEGALESYIGTAEEPQSGRIAKAAYFFQELGVDIAEQDVAGVDLLDRLESVVGDDGRLGSYEDVYGQSFAAAALHAAGSAEADAATDALVGFRCEGAGWGYDDFSSGECVSAADGTAYTLLALLPQADGAEADPEVVTAVDGAVAWLEDNQKTDGGFGDWGVNNNGTTSEANGTGLAAWALGAAGETAAAERAAGWIADHQLARPAGCATSPVPGEEGALAYDDSNIESAITNGITETDLGTWTFAGAQALAGLSHLGERPASAATLSAPTGYVHAGTPISVKVTGLRPGLQACLTGAGRSQWVVGSETVRTTLPRGTARHVVRLTHADGATSRTVQALGRARFKVRVPARIKAKRKARIVVAGLAPREVTTVRVGKRKVTRRASATGRLVVRYRAPRAKGKLRVSVVGEFRDRTGGARFRVV